MRGFGTQPYRSTDCGSFTGDTHLHSWQVLVKILESEDAMGMLVDVGM